MAKFRKVEKSETEFELEFMCPGCKEIHTVNNHWPFNGNLEEPTLVDSVLVKWGGLNKQCHSIISGGFIQFMEDCTHELKGQVLELPQIEAIKK